MVTKPCIIVGFQKVLCVPFIKSLMTNIRKTLQMNITMSQKYYFGIS